MSHRYENSTMPTSQPHDTHASRRVRITAIAALVVGLSVAVSSPALAVGYTGGSLSTNSAAAGGTVTYTSNATGFDETTSATLTLTCPSGTDIDTVPFGSDGILRATLTLPTDAAAGDECVLTVAATSQTDTFSDTRTITIAGAPVDGLPNTGASSAAPIAWFGVGALALGIAAVVVALVTRRSRSNA